MALDLLHPDLSVSWRSSNLHVGQQLRYRGDKEALVKARRAVIIFGTIAFLFNIGIIAAVTLYLVLPCTRSRDPVLH